jgi:hypothetical protein
MVTPAAYAMVVPTQVPRPPDPEGDRDVRNVREPLEPLDPPMVPFAVTGLVAWAVAGLALLVWRSTLAEHGRESWLWICFYGFGLGLPGLYVMIRHDVNRRRRRSGRSARPPRPPRRRTR